MYHNSGAIVKGLATFIAVLLMIACVALGSFIMVRAENNAMGLAVIFGGSLVSWLSCLMMAAFGELVNNSYKILKILSENKPSAQMMQPAPQYVPAVHLENAVPVQYNEPARAVPVQVEQVSNTSVNATACPNCGTPRKGTSPFCAFCGTKF